MLVPTYKFPVMPTPPATVNAPTEVLVLDAVLVITRLGIDIDVEVPDSRVHAVVAVLY